MPTTGLRAEALRDTLTGLGNHRAFQEEMERQWAIAAGTGRSMALAAAGPRRLQAP
jgi:PleD family two-component response regulator